MIPKLSDLIDIHVHILPGLDDGPQSMQECLRVADLYQKSGITALVATPHFLPGTAWSPSKEKILSLVERLQIELNLRDINLKIMPGMEIGFHSKLSSKIQTNELLPLGNSEHYLIEPSFHGEQQELTATLLELLKKGTRLILAHPERVDAFQNNPEFLEGLVHEGLSLQINSGSLLGYFGKDSQKLALEIKRRGWLHFIASDTHNHIHRSPLSIQEWQMLLDSSGGTDMLLQCIANVNSLFNSEQQSRCSINPN